MHSDEYDAERHGRLCYVTIRNWVQSFLRYHYRPNELGYLVCLVCTQLNVIFVVLHGEYSISRLGQDQSITLCFSLIEVCRKHREFV